MDMKDGAISYDDYFAANSGLNVRPSIESAGPPPEEGAKEGDTVCTADNIWVRAEGRWVPLCSGAC